MDLLLLAVVGERNQLADQAGRIMEQRKQVHLVRAAVLRVTTTLAVVVDITAEVPVLSVAAVVAPLTPTLHLQLQ